MNGAGSSGEASEGALDVRPKWWRAWRLVEKADGFFFVMSSLLMANPTTSVCREVAEFVLKNSSRLF
jgi:hypothetical protein